MLKIEKTPSLEIVICRPYLQFSVFCFFQCPFYYQSFIIYPTLVFFDKFICSDSRFRKNCKQDDPLFTTFEHNTCSNTPIDYIHIRKMLSDLKERTKLEKRLYQHLFRHSRATYYANFLTEQQAKGTLDGLVAARWSQDTRIWPART